MFNLKKFIFSFALIFCLFSFAPGIFAYEKSIEDLAAKFNISAEKMDTILADGNKKLVPMISSDKDFYISLFSEKENSGHMKYYGNGKIMSKNSSERVFKRRIARMWNGNKPQSLAFIVKEDGKSVGFVAAGPVDNPSCNPEIARVIDKKFAGIGLGTFAAKKLVSVMQELKNLGIYKYEYLVSTSKPNNLASRNSILKAGFTTKESIVKTEFGNEKIYKYHFS